MVERRKRGTVEMPVGSRLRKEPSALIKAKAPNRFNNYILLRSCDEANSVEGNMPRLNKFSFISSSMTAPPSPPTIPGFYSAT